MKMELNRNTLEKLKDSLVDGCLLYDGAICVLTLVLATSVVLSYGALSLQ